jgi:hypothetical protein
MEMPLTEAAIKAAKPVGQSAGPRFFMAVESGDSAASSARSIED